MSANASNPSFFIHFFTSSHEKIAESMLTKLFASKKNYKACHAKRLLRTVLKSTASYLLVSWREVYILIKPTRNSFKPFPLSCDWTSYDIAVKEETPKNVWNVERPIKGFHKPWGKYKLQQMVNSRQLKALYRERTREHSAMYKSLIRRITL